MKFEGRDLRALDEEALRKVRGGEIGFVFQDPMTSFNPVMRIGEQLAEPLRHHRGLSRAEAMGEAGRLMRVVGIPGGEARLSDYPHQLSGGMRQRVMIAMSIACQPRLLIANEPTTALDVTTQAQIVDLVAELRLRLGLAVIWISHDLALVSEVADRIMVLYSGKVIEEGPTRAICDNPRHPHTQGLLASIPTLGMVHDRRLTSIPGMPPDPALRPPGCPFAPRCGSWIARCDEAMPTLEALAPGHRVACFVAERKAAVG